MNSDVPLTGYRDIPHKFEGPPCGVTMVPNVDLANLVLAEGTARHELGRLIEAANDLIAQPFSPECKRQLLRAVHRAQVWKSQGDADAIERAKPWPALPVPPG